MGNIGSIMHMEAGCHFLVIGPTKCGITSNWEPFSPSLIISSSMSYSRLPLRTLHWEYSPLGGSLERTENISSSLIRLEIPDFLLKHLKTNENVGSKTTLCVLEGTGRMCGKKSVRLGKLFRLYTFLLMFYI